MLAYGLCLAFLSQILLNNGQFIPYMCTKFGEFVLKFNEIWYIFHE